MSTVAIEPAGDAIRVVRLARPERLNAISFELVADLHDALDEVAADEACKVAVLTGAGRGFCAGLDLRDFGTPPSAGEHPHFPAGTTGQSFMANLTQHIRATPQIVLAAVNGPAYGGGLSLALACDLRYAADSAVLTTAFAKVGFSGDYGGTWFLTQIVGTAKARELYYFSDRLSAAEAEQAGVVNGVFPAALLAAEVDARARRLAAGPRVAHRYMKDALNRAVTGDLVECLDLEASFHNHTGLTEDHQEAARAFVEKRPPVFRGR
jgi:2-(1,2-epoxy-1,2-dihydrophenyl)acetyl-CoA isomerase